MARADRLDQFGLQTDCSPALHGRLLDGFQVLVGSVRPVMAPQVVPEILHRVQFRRPRRQPDQRDVRWHHQRLGPVIACSVPDQCDMLVRRDGFGQPVEELLRGIRVDMLSDQALGLAGARTDCREDVQTLEPALLRSPRPRTLVRPDGR